MTDLKGSVEEFKQLSQKVDDVVTADDNTSILINGRIVPSVQKQLKDRFDNALPHVNSIARAQAAVAVAASKRADKYRKDVITTTETSKYEMSEIQEEARLSESISHLQGAAAVLAAKIAEDNNADAQNALINVLSIAQQVSNHLDQVLSSKNQTDTNKLAVLALKNDCEEILNTVQSINLSSFDLLEDIQDEHAAVREINNVVAGMLKRTFEAAEKAEQSRKNALNSNVEFKHKMSEIQESAQLSETISHLQGATAVLAAKIAEDNNADAQNALINVLSIAQQVSNHLDQVLSSKNQTDTNKLAVLALKNNCEEILQTVNAMSESVAEMRNQARLSQEKSESHVVELGNMTRSTRLELEEDKEQLRVYVIMTKLQSAAAILSAQLSESNSAVAKSVMKNLFGKVLSGTLTQDDVNNI